MIYLYIYIYIYINIYTCTYIYTDIYTYTYMYVHMNTYIYIYMNTFIYISICCTHYDGHSHKIVTILCNCLPRVHTMTVLIVQKGSTMSSCGPQRRRRIVTEFLLNKGKINCRIIYV